MIPKEWCENIANLFTDEVSQNKENCLKQLVILTSYNVNQQQFNNNYNLYVHTCYTMSFSPQRPPGSADGPSFSWHTNTLLTQTASCNDL